MNLLIIDFIQIFNFNTIYSEHTYMLSYKIHYELSSFI